MRPTGLRLLALSSVLLLLSSAFAATRPHYGGTLRVMERAAPATLDPATPRGIGDLAPELSALLYDTVLKLDEHGTPQAGLAETWKLDEDGRKLQVWLRPRLHFSDGTELTADTVADSLASANPEWHIRAVGASVVIETDKNDAHLIAALALPRNAIVRRAEKVVGSGAFKVERWQGGQSLVLSANEDYWDGRPFLDRIEVEFGRNSREQMIGLESGRADVIEAGVDTRSQQAHSIRSDPSELIALVFGDRGSASQPLREALSYAVNRQAMASGILQKQGEPAGGLLPNWLSGYEFVFPSGVDISRARGLRSQMSRPAVLKLSYDPADPVMSLIAERVALNARDAYITLDPVPVVDRNADLRLVRVPLASIDPAFALELRAADLGVPLQAMADSSAQSRFNAERALIESRVVIPLLHVSRSWATGSNVHDLGWMQHSVVNFAEAWVEAGQR